MTDVIHRLNYERIFQGENQIRIENAQNRDYFYDQDNDAIGQILRADLSPFMDTADISRLNPITLDQFVYSFLEKVCNVYDRPPVFQFPEGVKPASKEAFMHLMDEVQIHQVMQENFLRTRLHNSILVTVKWSKQLDRLFIENGYNEGNTFVVPHDEYLYEPRIVAYETVGWDNKLLWIVWDREANEHYATKELPKYDPASRQVLSEKIPIPPAKSIAAPPIWPWTAYHYRRQNDFWGNGLDGLIQLARSINVLLTVLNDDSIRETIRLLILNFNPAGSKGEKGQLKTGLTHPIYPESRVGDGSGPTADVVSADLYTEEIIGLIDKLTEIVSSTHNIPNPLKSQMTEALAGVTLRMKNEPLLQQWEKDQGILRPYDRDLLGRIVEANNFFRPGARVDPGILAELSVKYSDPSIVTDEAADLATEELKWRAGVSSPVAYVQSKHPEMTEKEAEEFIRKNLAQWNDLMGLKVQVNTPGDKKNLNGEGDEDADED
jgi:hypothetical protein